MNSVAAWITTAVSFLFLPILISMVDFIPALHAKRALEIEVGPDSPRCDDFAVLVPIYGNIKYLENVHFLEQYGHRVVLCTTDQETEEFYSDLDSLVQQFNFRVVRAALNVRSDGTTKRSTSSPIRDVIVRAAVRTVSEKYVVCLDADSLPDQGFEYLIGEMEAHRFEMTSVRLVVENPESLLGRLQVVEYFLAMNLRRVIPWLISGGCHAATTAAYRQAMERHSLFFQGNDVEVGLLAERMGYHVGHVGFRVRTEVPDRVAPWFRQRFAWSGGEWRLAVANIKCAPSHPLFFFYATIVMIGMCPIRVYTCITAPWIIPIVYCIYVVLISILRRHHLNWIVFVYPLYGFWTSLVMIPLGGISYLNMSIRHRNWGLIDRDKTRGAYLQPKSGWY